MSRLPKMNLWIDAFNSDTSFLTEEELGVYMRMIFYAWSREAYLPNDLDFIYMLTKKVDKKVVRKVLDMYWTKDERGYFQKRLKEEYDLAQSIIARNTMNGSKGGRPKINPNETQIKPSTSTSTSISKFNSITDLVNEDELQDKYTFFEQFWGNINNKVSKGKARANYLSLSIDWAKKFKELAEKYNEYCDKTDKKYTMLPSTWLFNENYLDEIAVEKDTREEDERRRKEAHADMYKKGIRLLTWSPQYMKELEKINNANG